MLRAFAVTVIALVALAGLALSAQVASADNSYEVQDGDTLLAIAAKLGVPSGDQLDWVASTVKLNNLGDADSLKLGHVLKLPSSGPSAPATVSATTTSTTTTTASGGSTYAVQDGDTLLAVAAKLGVPADQRLAWLAKVLTLNGMTSAEQLAIGQTLKLPSEAAQPVATAATTTTTQAVAVTSTPTSGSSTTSATATATGTFKGYASAYHDSFTNKTMGCMGAGPYKPTDLTIIAVGPAMHQQFPCGTQIEVCGPKGCITGLRKDSCPGCKDYHVDLSRAGLTAVCGPNACDIRLRRLP